MCDNVTPATTRHVLERERKEDVKVPRGWTDGEKAAVKNSAEGRSLDASSDESGRGGRGAEKRQEKKTGKHGEEERGE